MANANEAKIKSATIEKVLEVSCRKDTRRAHNNSSNKALEASRASKR